MNNNSQVNVWNIIVPAKGSTFIPQNGSLFFVQLTTGTIAIRASTNQFGGQFNVVPAGYGIRGLTFTKLEVKNSTANAIVASIFVGDGDIIVNPTLANLSQAAGLQTVSYPTQPNSATLPTNVPIPDLTGTGFTDINGVKWLAVSRVQIEISNLDSGVTYLLQKYGAATANGVAVKSIPPNQVIIHQASGNFALNVGGGTINCLVDEIYQAIPATS